MDDCRHTGLVQPGLDGLTARYLDGVLGRDASAVRSDRGKLDLAQRRGGANEARFFVALRLRVTSNQFPIPRGRLLACGELLVGDIQFGQKDGGLEGVHAAVYANDRVTVAPVLAVDADFAHALGQFVVIGEAGVAAAVAGTSTVTRNDQWRNCIGCSKQS